MDFSIPPQCWDATSKSSPYDRRMTACLSTISLAEASRHLSYYKRTLCTVRPFSCRPLLLTDSYPSDRTNDFIRHLSSRFVRLLRAPGSLMLIVIGAMSSPTTPTSLLVFCTLVTRCLPLQGSQHVMSHAQEKLALHRRLHLGECLPWIIIEQVKPEPSSPLPWPFVDNQGPVLQQRSFEDLCR